jgi:hypothetical protein
MRFTPAQIDDIKARNPVPAVAGQWVKLRPKGRGGKFVGSCPLCSTSDSATAGRFECTADKWVCAVCPDGGDVIRLVARRAGLDPARNFAEVIELLGGTRAIEETPQTARRRGEQHHGEGKPVTVPDDYRGNSALCVAFVEGWNAAAEKSAVNARYRERERLRLYENFWQRAGQDSRAKAVDYLTRRGLEVPAAAKLRWLARVPYFLDGKENSEPIAYAAAMLAPIMNVDPRALADSCDDVARGFGYRFAGLHFTYLDPATPDGKAVIRHPDTGEKLPAKKVRGTKQGGYIDLGGRSAHQARGVVSGEGIENVLAGFTMLVRAGRDVGAAAIHFRAGVDLGNLAGKAMDRLSHPTAVNEKTGRAVSVPGVVPDRDALAMPLPATIERVTWMCDGDSDAFATRAAMARTGARHARDDLKQVFMWPGDGCDWNDRVKPRG